MLRAAAAFLGLFVIWVLLAQRFSALQDFAFGALAALCAVAIGTRFAGSASPVFAFAPRFFLLALSRGSSTLRGCASTLRAALAADVSLTPGLARLKTRSADATVRAELANLISASPGSVMVDADAEGLLLHLINEDAADASGFAHLEARVSSALGAGALS